MTKLVVGLGNPGSKYVGTRHNFGFDVVADLARQFDLDLKFESRFNAAIGKGLRGATRWFLVQPYSFMNLSGDVVQPITAYFEIAIEDVIVIADDADLPLGAIRLRAQGSSGGHRGLLSIENRLKTKDFARQKLGIGRRDERRDIKDYVLGKFSKDELEMKDEVARIATRQIECWALEGCVEAMSRYNGTINLES